MKHDFLCVQLDIPNWTQQCTICTHWRCDCCYLHCTHIQFWVQTETETCGTHEPNVWKAHQDAFSFQEGLQCQVAFGCLRGSHQAVACKVPPALWLLLQTCHWEVEWETPCHMSSAPAKFCTWSILSLVQAIWQDDITCDICCLSFMSCCSE